jgi:hypothetical protein
MSTTKEMAGGGYLYVPGVFQYSGGVAAVPGNEIERVRFAEPVPLKEGFRRAAEVIQAAGQPLQSFCACELRSPAPFDDAGFRSFNETYVGTLKDWGLFELGDNPVARSNVCPELQGPAEPSFHSFAFARRSSKTSERRSFIVSGSAEVPEGTDSYGENAIAAGNTSADGMRAKARWVLGEMERRMMALGTTWQDTTAVQIYSVFDFHSFLADEIVSRGAARHGVTWHFNRPPLTGLDYEMDCRGISIERVI